MTDDIPEDIRKRAEDAGIDLDELREQADDVGEGADLVSGVIHGIGLSLPESLGIPEASVCIGIHQAAAVAAVAFFLYLTDFDRARTMKMFNDLQAKMRDMAEALADETLAERAEAPSPTHTGGNA